MGRAIRHGTGVREPTLVELTSRHPARGATACPHCEGVLDAHGFCGHCGWWKGWPWYVVRKVCDCGQVWEGHTFIRPEDRPQEVLHYFCRDCLDREAAAARAADERARDRTPDTKTIEPRKPTTEEGY